ncbi:MAG: endonuclease/exonuclease/phosphatase family protein [Alphaproteobacteria bacterium]|nr:endonuclease/exonuclease/phosphatase family protein [Alphaproteobacteria bacterium]
MGITITVVALAMLLGAVVLGRFDRAPGVWLTAALFVLPYLFVVHVAWTFALWALLPDRRSLPVVLGATLLAMAALWGPALAARGQDAEGTPITVMSWNVRRLWGGPDDGGDALRCAVQAIEAASPDVLALMEVSRDNVRALEKALGMRCVHGTYNAGGADRHGGLAACARGGTHLVDGAALRFVDDEDWHYVAAEVEREGRVFNLLAVHLTPYRLGASQVAEARRTAAGQANQSAALLERVARFQDPTVVAGDFNSTRDFYLHSALRTHLTDVWERAGLGPGATKLAMDWLPLRIDYIYASDAFAVRDASVPQVGCSDHRPVVSALVLRDR